ncbi:hypothetical protein GBZ48_17775 [Azospirillum melinis]|uniref:Reverse transcriptase domain-containing protein n=1 Tax=Azospirillum melinis TaxID=328839 RepID=A0ABX2KF58_9PROT|nr:antiviral reverse transcriptase Drt2 [Azospirillum melinis]MBP2304608.1 hypothetical protein [Azospirillum melinis]NUB01126.1 hypothetical protein [Azospirillum melinis]
MPEEILTTPIVSPPALPLTLEDLPITFAVDRRGYPHFDLPNDALTVFEKVIDPNFRFCDSNFIAHHSFLPFISYEIMSARWDKEKKKKSEKRRKVAYASHVDAAIFQIYSSFLCWMYEGWIDSLVGESVIAYRAIGKTNIDFALDAFNYIKSRERCIVHALDLKDFFGSLDHSILKSRWSELLGRGDLPPDHYAVFKALAKHSCILRDDVFEVLGYGKRRQKRVFPRICSIKDFRKQVRPRVNIEKNGSSKGIVQGSPLSACASNIYMMHFDRSMVQFCLRIGAYYRRYSDDILVVCEPEQEEAILTALNSLIEEHLLVLHDGGKCIRTEYHSGKILEKPIQYLGFIFDGNRILLRPSSLARYWRKMKLNVKKRKFCIRSAAKLGKSERIYKGTLLKKFTHFGKKHNFPAYVANACETIGEAAIKGQIKRHVSRLNQFIREKY